MGLTQLSTPYPVFTDKNGTPLDNGYVYFGVINDNPETAPIQVYFDPGLTQPAAQPLRTSNGYIMRNGSPAILYAASLFSVTLRDKNGALVVYAPAGYGTSPYDIAGPASAEVVIVAGIAADVTAVAAIADDVEAVGTISADVTTVAGIAADVTAVADDATDIGIVAANIGNVNTVAGISANVTTVAGISAAVTAVAADSVDIGVVAANIADVNTVAGVSVDVSTVAANNANVTTVATNIASVNAVAADVADINTVAANIADVSTVAGISGDVTIVAMNVADIENFADVYQGAKPSDPATRNDGSPLQAGDLYFNTTLDLMYVYTGTVWESISLSPSIVVQKTSATGSAIVPAGTTGERDGFPTAGYFRFNSTLGKFEGYTGTAWGSVGGGATGGGSDEVFFENGQIVTTNYTITNGKNAMSAGPITINSGVTVTVGTGEVWTIV